MISTMTLCPQLKSKPEQIVQIKMGPLLSEIGLTNPWNPLVAEAGVKGARKVVRMRQLPEMQVIHLHGLISNYTRHIKTFIQFKNRKSSVVSGKRRIRAARQLCLARSRILIINQANLAARS